MFLTDEFVNLQTLIRWQGLFQQFSVELTQNTFLLVAKLQPQNPVFTCPPLAREDLADRGRPINQKPFECLPYLFTIREMFNNQADWVSGHRWAPRNQQ